LDKDANQRPIRAAARASCVKLHFGILNLVEKKDDLDMRKLIQSQPDNRE
jgi:hypothetical protein